VAYMGKFKHLGKSSIEIQGFALFYEESPEGKNISLKDLRFFLLPNFYTDINRTNPPPTSIKVPIIAPINASVE